MQIVPFRAAPLWKHGPPTLEVRSPLIVDIWVNRISSGNRNFFTIISRVLVHAIHPEMLTGHGDRAETASGRRRRLVLLPKQKHKMPRYAF